MESELFFTDGDPPARFRLASPQPAWPLRRLVGVTGVEPVTLRLSSACSNQLSYTPRRLRRNFKFQIRNLKLNIGGAEETRTPDL